jgi:hypothetical protein
MNLDFNGTQPVLVYGLHSQLVVTTALILTFSPWRRDTNCMRLFTRLCVVRIQSRMLGGSGGQCASLLGEISPPGEGETVPAALVNHAFGWLKTVPRSNCQGNTFHNFQTITKDVYKPARTYFSSAASVTPSSGTRVQSLSGL